MRSADQKMINTLIRCCRLRRRFSTALSGVHHEQIFDMIHCIRDKGHLIANLNPIEEQSHALDYLLAKYCRSDVSSIKQSNFKVTLMNPVREQVHWDVNELSKYLASVYCGNVGVEYMHLLDREQVRWLQTAVENKHGSSGWKLDISDSKHIDILNQLVISHTVGEFFNKKFPKSKVFGLQGMESVSCAMYSVLETLSKFGTEAVDIGMAHRGRMNFLSSLFRKPMNVMCGQFTESEPYIMHDVKFHSGARCYIDVFPDDHTKRTIRCSLSANPSHLELINPVVLGVTKAIQFAVGDKIKCRIVPILIHGDASFSAQGIVPETLELAQLPEYDVGGCIHLVINNQIGFTTEPADGRSGHHCTDMAKVIQAPIFHVNGDDVEAVISVCQLAAEYRQKFNKDVIIDIIGYRRFGHSSLEDPTTTLPLLYTRIKAHPSVVSLYSQELALKGIITDNYVTEYTQMLWNQYEAEFHKSIETVVDKTEWFSANWQGSALGHMIKNRPFNQTGMRRHVLQYLGHALTTVPDDFVLHPEVQQLMNARKRMLDGKDGISMGFAESLAFAALLAKYNATDKLGLHRNTIDPESSEEHAIPEFTKGDDKLAEMNDHPSVYIRLSGQDSVRGTFNQRHAAVVCQKTGRTYWPINNIGPNAATMTVCNSNLSEAAVLGFEYGYSLGNELALVLWEAQFGDFANMAQAYIDNFIASGESKWGHQSSMILLLPHGYDGQGPEHSSGRIERFLQLVNEDDIAIPGNNYILRKEMESGFDALVAKANTSINGNGTSHSSNSNANGNNNSLSRKAFTDVILQTFGAATATDDETQKFTHMTVAEILDDVCSASDRITKSDWCRMMSSWLQWNAERDRNLIVVYPSTPAQYYHAIRRQIHRPFAKPLIVFTPKVLYHHKPCASSLEDLELGTYFHRVITEGHKADNMKHRVQVITSTGSVSDTNDSSDNSSSNSNSNPGERKKLVLHTDNIQRVVFVTGKLFYPLFHARQAAQCSTVVFVRIEQIAPFPYDLVASAILKYPNATDLVWCQEEPKNMGAWSYIKPRMDNILIENAITGRNFIRFVGRKASASTATGSFKQHTFEQNQIIEEILRFD